MEPGLEFAEIAMRNKLQNIQIVANNLANINTTGFKRGLAFSEVFDQEQQNITTELTDFSEGVFVETNDPLNVAISGNAYFTVKTPDGEHLTKNGDFIIDQEGYLANREGFRVMAQNGEVNLQEHLLEGKKSLVITKNGEIKADDLIIARLKIQSVNDNKVLEKAEGQRFFTSDKIYNAVNETEFEIHHGYLESSNTNAILEMQAMIQLQKDYEAAQKMITSLDDTLSQTNEIGQV